MEIKLISMAAYVHQTVEKEKSHSWKLQYIWDFADFLKKSLNLGMFIPAKLVDGVWVVLEEPIDNTCKNCDHKEAFDICCHFEEYQQAKSNVIFEGFEIEYFNYGGDVSNESSYQIISKETDVQICIYKAQPDYFIWNYKTIEDLIPYNLTLTPEWAEKLGL